MAQRTEATGVRGRYLVRTITNTITIDIPITISITITITFTVTITIGITIAEYYLLLTKFYCYYYYNFKLIARCVEQDL